MELHSDYLLLKYEKGEHRELLLASIWNFQDLSISPR